MFLSSNSDIFNIFRLHIIILWGEMGIMRWLYCSALSSSCLLNTKKTTVKIRGSSTSSRGKRIILSWSALCAQRSPPTSGSRATRPWHRTEVQQNCQSSLIWRLFGSLCEYVLHCKVSLVWDLPPHPCEIKVINTGPATGSYTDPSGLTRLPRCIWAWRRVYLQLFLLYRKQPSKQREKKRCQKSELCSKSFMDIF